MVAKSFIRLDEALIQRGLAASLEEARALILTGKVLVGEQKIEMAATRIKPSADIRVKPLPRYVGRGGEKLAAALAELGLSGLCQDAIVLDVGASTGGFTDCCLQHGAQRVYALDIGSNQLAWKMRSHPQVTAMEKTDIRKLAAGYFKDVNLVVADISFNSIAVLLPAIVRVVPLAAVHYLMLVKPQFELPRPKIPQGGVVTDAAHRSEALALVVKAFRDLGFAEGRSVASALKGRSGNQEIFYYTQATP